MNDDDDGDGEQNIIMASVMMVSMQGGAMGESIWRCDMEIRWTVVWAKM